MLWGSRWCVQETAGNLTTLSSAFVVEEPQLDPHHHHHHHPPPYVSTDFCERWRGHTVICVCSISGQRELGVRVMMFSVSILVCTLTEQMFCCFLRYIQEASDGNQEDSVKSEETTSFLFRGRERSWDVCLQVCSYGRRLLWRDFPAGYVEVSQFGCSESPVNRSVVTVRFGSSFCPSQLRIFLCDFSLCLFTATHPRLRVCLPTDFSPQNKTCRRDLILQRVWFPLLVSWFILDCKWKSSCLQSMLIWGLQILLFSCSFF